MKVTRKASKAAPKAKSTQERYPNGALKSVGRYEKGQRVGRWKFYHRDGKLWSSGTYDEGEAIGLFKWYAANGVLRQSGRFSDGKQVGLWKRYHGGTGQLYDIGKYNPAGKKIGLWKVFDKKGKLVRSKRS